MNEYLQKMREDHPELADLPDDALVAAVYRERVLNGPSAERFPTLNSYRAHIGMKPDPQEQRAQVRRNLAVAGGDVAEGVASMVDLPANIMNLAMLAHRRGVPGPQIPTLTPHVSERVPQATTPEGRVASAALQGAVGGAGIGGLLSRLGVYAPAAAQALGGGLGAATTAAGEQAGLPAAVTVPAGMVAGGVGASQSARALPRALGGGRLEPGAQQIVDEAARLNVPLRPGDVKSPTSFVRRAEDMLEAGPGREMNRIMEQQAQAMSGALEREAARVAPTGMSLGSADEFAVGRLRSLYDAARTRVRPLFREAEHLAGDDPVSTPNTMSSITEMTTRVERAGPGSNLARLMGELQDEAVGGIPYRDLRQYHSLIGAEMASLRQTPGANEVLLRAAGRLYDDMQRDVDRWAMGAGPAGVAHQRAMQAFRDEVVPFRQDPAIYRAARSTGRDAYDLASENFIPRTVGLTGEGNPQRTSLLMDLLDEEGRQAVGYRIFGRAADDAQKAISNEISPSAAVRSFNLRSPDRPTASRIALRGAGQEQTAENLTDLLRATQRSVGRAQQPATGFRNVPLMSMLGAGGGGYALGGPMGALAGAAMAPAAANVTSRAMVTDPILRWLMARSASPLGGMAGATASGR